MSVSVQAELVLFVRAIIRELVTVHHLAEPAVSVSEENSIDMCYAEHSIYCTVCAPEFGMMLLVDTYATLVKFSNYSEAEAKNLALAILSHINN